MRKILPLFILLMIPFQVFAVSNLKLNGSSELTIPTLPTDVVMTCDLAQSGNSIHLEIVVDANMSGTLDPNDMVVEFSKITDGIGWIQDPENPDEDLAGDETGIDGKIKTTFPLEKTDVAFQAGAFLVKVTDEDGSVATAKLSVLIQPQPPVIMGKITDKNTGSPIEHALVFAASSTEDFDAKSAFGISDENGDYFLNVSAGEWYVGAFELTQNRYQHSDTLEVTLGEDETRTLDIELAPYETFVQGQTKKENGDPVPGILIIAESVQSLNFSFVNSDENGNYKLGVTEGLVIVAPSIFSYVFTGQSEWPEGYYADPAVDSLTLSKGQTATVDFIFKPYSSFIEGVCKVGDTPLPGVEITAFSTNFQSGQFQVYTTTSDENGRYKLGVHPGIVSMLTADKDGYDMTSPLFGYTNINVGDGQTVSGQDFIFAANSEAMFISGNVKYENNANANNVYVAAVENDAESEEGYRILHTDENGFFQFDGLYSGYWKVGIYEDGYISEPPLFYTDVMPGDQITDANFTLKTSTGVAAGAALQLPTQFKVTQNYPNPFNPEFKSASTQIHFTLAKPAEVNVIIYNINGQVVKQFQQGRLNGGQHQVLWNGRDEIGRVVPTGVYFYRVMAGNKSQTRRMILVR